MKVRQSLYPRNLSTKPFAKVNPRESLYPRNFVPLKYFYILYISQIMEQEGIKVLDRIRNLDFWHLIGQYLRYKTDKILPKYLKLHNSSFYVSYLREMSWFLVKNLDTFSSLFFNLLFKVEPRKSFKTFLPLRAIKVVWRWLLTFQFKFLI